MTAGVVFIVCIPSQEYEKALKKKNKKKVEMQERTFSASKNKDMTSAATKKYSQTRSDGEECLLLSNKRKIEPNYESISENGVKKMCKCMSMQQVMETILKQLNIENSVWSKSSDNNYMQVIFSWKIDSLYEEVLETLKEYDIGSKYNSVVSVVPCTVHYKGQLEDVHDSTYSDEHDMKLQSKNSGWSKFLLSMRTRLTVAQVVENIRHQAALTFDFICLLVIASTICAIGLVENNNVYLISSMLISPMMGPVMASTFGKVIRDRILQKMGVYNELLGLGIATVIGFIYGAIICVSTNKYGEVEWPTTEMTSRGEIRTIGVGCLIALLSGAAVALAVLSDNISSLVGVAISTSLMPPAVNAGLLWSLASVYYIKGNETTRYSSLTSTNYFSDNMAMELTSLGATSLCLTFVNIICIYVAGILVFKIKEVAPIASRDLMRRQFWNHDIKIARDFNKTQNDLRNGLADHHMKYRYRKLIDDFHHSTDLSYGADKIKIKRSQQTWSPCMLSSQVPTMQDVRNLCNNILKEPDARETLNLSRFTETTTVLSQIFSPLSTGITNVQDPEKPPIETPEASFDDNMGNGRKILKKAKRFVVTPCAEPTRSEYEYP